ncbi:hypothetical protein ACFE04_020664 [Oxalis oulophora]
MLLWSFDNADKTCLPITGPNGPNITNFSSLQRRLHPLIRDLNTFWPDIQTSNNIRFWRHEWNEHETAAYQVFIVPEAYFSKSVEIKHGYDILRSLAQNGVTFGSNFKLSKVEGVLDTLIGRITFIHEIVLSFDFTGNNPVACVKKPIIVSTRSICGRTVRFA